MFLTPDEIVTITGYIRPSSQRDWLKRNGWTFEVDGNGRPIVLRAYVETRMGVNGHAAAPAPNFSAIRREV